ncbi:NEDD8 activating enzyme E1-type Uba3 [Schizosaccharomyces osmophilus]|uniref:NEDD8-activating enzyme E1 catalytic subunit n=1 Tax=Schizosaccharomyces osmophilus TaxID=2545709 RepID=A0AAE9W9A0_9SCHI|nr:NEDD8 activating enzyme E1-type Uba3 [Schizosaccharomyces osmophilus]WBW71713.1 NEDD8 activating enzyme E1-type Uba3 [Schizosaccharomyces osmophilus]
MASVAESAAQKDELRHDQWSQILRRPGPFAPDVDPQLDFHDLFSSKILVVGAGGLGCEILKNLALSGFRELHVIDMDTIDVSNLNRQFLFTEHDVGNSKASVAAKAIMRRIPSTTVIPFHGRIQDKSFDYYKQFQLVVCGLDSVEARRWINSTLVSIAKGGDFLPLIDGGSEGLKGQARVILPSITSCYECSLEMLTPKTSYPICTIANTPRLPEHCVEWAFLLEWPRVAVNNSENTKSSQEISLQDEGSLREETSVSLAPAFDPDIPWHVDWIVDRARARAAAFEINAQDIDRFFVLGIVKRIIPAVASTNAIIAAACCNEALKILTDCNPTLDNYMMFVGEDATYTFTFNLEKRSDCSVCGALTESYPFSKARPPLLSTLIHHYQTKYQLHSPSVSSTSGFPLYFSSPLPLQQATATNLSKSILDLISPSQQLVFTDKALTTSLYISLQEITDGP